MTPQIYNIGNSYVDTSESTWSSFYCTPLKTNTSLFPFLKKALTTFGVLILTNLWWYRQNRGKCLEVKKFKMFGIQLHKEEFIIFSGVTV